MVPFTPSDINKCIHMQDNQWVAQYSGYELRSVFQPIYEKSSHSIYGYEGLIRVSIEGKQVNPLDFFRRFVDEWEIIFVGTLCGSLHVRNFVLTGSIEKLFVNIHPTMFISVSSDLRWVSVILEKLTLEGMPANQVVWEITESGADDLERFVSGVEAFRKADNSFAIDDLGQHESNEFRVKLLKPEYVKIDRNLINTFCNNQQSHHLPHLISAFKNKEIKVILEGVENLAEHDAIEPLAYDYVQGFYYGKPVGVHKFSRVVWG